MDPKLQLRVQRYGWDEAAPRYEAAWQAPLRPAHDTLLAMAELRPGHHVIETACGTGMATFRASDAVGEDGRVLATDLSQRMIDEITRRAIEAGRSNITAARMSAEELSVEPGCFDRALCALGLMYVPDPARALAELYRVLKPGGRATVTVWGERRNCGWAEIFPIVDARVASEVCPLFFGTGAPGVLKGLMEGTGFVSVEERRQREVLRFATGEDIVDAVVRAGPVALAVKRFPDAVMADVRDEFLESVKPYRSADGVHRLNGEFVTVSGLAAS
ncbi:class I SAM-dependent methyltransferase [uncultured Limimaricola sp.]|uniref:class I SAM-dependent methyltransferase n=1 Tax=uncultured Limimaricola sp. TaxID=2211667 RepID=UPI0030F645A9